MLNLKDLIVIMKVAVQEIREKLIAATQQKQYTIYKEGIKLFLKQWDEKTSPDITRLCIQIKEVIKGNRAIAEIMLGKKTVRYFDSIQTA